MMQPFRFFAARGQFISIKEDFACTYVEQFIYQNSFGIESNVHVVLLSLSLTLHFCLYTK